jgi:hypothetical protein
MDTSRSDRELVLDRFMEEYDFTRCELRVIDGPAEEVYQRARSLDFLEVRNRLMDTAMWIRVLPARLRGTELPVPPTMRPGDLIDDPPPVSEEQPWMALGEEPGRELVFGSVGRFWQTDIEWKPIAAEDFVAFDESGWGKIAASISTHPYGHRRCIAVYEARTTMTDPQSRARFGRYWRLVSPFVGVIMGGVLSELERRTG